MMVGAWPEAVVRWPESVVERVGSRIQVERGHWLWTGRMNRRGYGMLNVSGKAQYAHRVVWWLTKEAWPGRLMNRCGERRCVYPEHWREAVLTDGRDVC